MGIETGVEEEEIVVQEGGFAVPRSALCGAVVESGESGDGAHAACAVVGNGERRDDGFGKVHETALFPGYAAYLSWESC